jgi:hypothetical protein
VQVYATGIDDAEVRNLNIVGRRLLLLLLLLLLLAPLLNARGGRGDAFAPPLFFPFSFSLSPRVRALPTVACFLWILAAKKEKYYY